MTKIIIKKREVLLGVVSVSSEDFRDVNKVDALIKNKLLDKISKQTPTFSAIQELFLHYWNAYGLEVDDMTYGLVRFPLDNNGIQKGLLRPYQAGGVAELGKVVLDYMYIPSEDFLSGISEMSLDLPLRTAEVENMTEYLRTRGVNIEIVNYHE